MSLLFIGTTELLVIGGVALLIFGGKKLPELMRGLGKGVKEFKEGMNGTDEGHESEAKNHEPVEGQETKTTESRENEPAEHE